MLTLVDPVPRAADRREFVMRRSVLAVLLLGLSLPAAAQPDATPVYPQADSNIPGPFATYNVTGPRKGKYACLVTHHALNPVVMVVIRNTDMTDSLKKLLVKLDSAIDKNPNTRLAGFVVVLGDEIADIAASDDAREALEPKVEDIAKESNLKWLTLALDGKDRLKDDYKVGDGVEVAVLLYNRYKTVSFHALTREQLTDEKVNQILGEVAEKLGARR
jgi:hypothetical protein